MSAPPKPSELTSRPAGHSFGAAPCSADAFATELTKLTNKYIELGLTPEKAASVFTHAADSALDCLKWETALTKMLHKQIKTVAGLMRHHWTPSPPNVSTSATDAGNNH